MQLLETFRIPLKINGKLGLNKIYTGKHWAVRNKDKENILSLVQSCIKKRKQPYKEAVILSMCFNSRLDVSNHAYLFKMVEDSLVTLGLLKDDTDKFVKEVRMSKQKEFEGIIINIYGGEE